MFSNALIRFMNDSIKLSQNIVMRHYHGIKVPVNGINIHYEKVGNGNHTVLLMPGALGSSRTDFVPQLEGMNKEKFTLIAWDPPGYGHSRPPERDFVNYFRKDAALSAQLMKILGYEKYSIMGWSDGGITALIVSAANPDNVQKLVIWGSNCYVAEHDLKMANQLRDVNKWSAKARETYAKVYGPELFVKLWHSNTDAYAQYNDICKDDVKRIKCPTFVLHGDGDPFIGIEHVEYFMKNIKNVRVHRFPEGKHNIHQKYAQEFNKIVEEFLLEK